MKFYDEPGADDDNWLITASLQALGKKEADDFGFGVLDDESSPNDSQVEVAVNLETDAAFLRDLYQELFAEFRLRGIPVGIYQSDTSHQSLFGEMPSIKLTGKGGVYNKLQSGMPKPLLVTQSNQEKPTSFVLWTRAEVMQRIHTKLLADGFQGPEHASQLYTGKLDFSARRTAYTEGQFDVPLIGRDS